MPRFERYPNESPTVARRRIARNRAADRGNPGVGRAPGAVPPQPPKPGMTPRTGVNPATRKPEVPRPQRAPGTKGNLMGKGYNFTRNLGADDTPDIGY